MVPYAVNPRADSPGLRPEVRAALEADGWQAEYVDVSGSETAYHELLARVWSEGRGFVVVEQSIVVYPGAIGAMLDCPEPWDVTVYRVNAEYEGYLGCVEFSDALVQAVPDAMEAAGRLSYGPPPRYWGWVDNRLAQVLDERGFTKHRHWPAVKHLRRYPNQPVWNCACGAAIPEEIVASGPPPHRCPECEGRP